ncbi:LXG domain-containing protein [Psychrobacillus sp. FSL K6-4046]|uniref:ribonuclease YeeF family protein n=1 Tax=Psychrobacillus sp. FSL K6-4046 TaxID=2921550 RepID=UPI00315A2011
MKVLDVDLLQDGLQRNITMLERLNTEITTIQRGVEGLVQMEEQLKGEGGGAIRSFYEECHLPFLQFFQLFSYDSQQVLYQISKALNSLEPDLSGYILEEFLEGELEQELTLIGQLTASLTDETNSIMDQVSDIVALPHLDDSAVQEGVISSKRKRDDTLSQLYEFEATQTTALNTMEQDIRTMETWLSDIEGMFKSGLTDVHFQADNWGALTAKNKLKTELASRTSPIAVLSSIVNRENQLTTMLQAFIAGNGPIRFGYGGLIHINNPFVGTDMLVLSCARPESGGIEQEKINIQKNSNIFQDFYDLGIGALKSVATINPFDDKSFGEAMLERANDVGQRQTDDFVEVQRFTHRTANTSLLGLPSELHKAGTGEEHLFYTTREFGEGGGTDLIADMLGYGVPGLGAVKAIRGTSLGAKGLTTGISARNLGQFAKEGAAVGSIMSAGEIGSRELLNPEDTNWKQNASELGLNIAAGATLDPLFSMAVPIAKSVQKMVNEKAIVEAVNSPSKIGERIPKGTVKIEGMPPLVQSRVNLRNGSAAEGAGFNHVLDRHFNPSKNASQFSITPDVLKGVLQSKEVVNTPVSKVLYSDIKLADGTIEKQARYVREVTLDSNIGIDKFSGSPTNIMTVLTDKYGNLVTTTPGVIK